MYTFFNFFLNGKPIKIIYLSYRGTILNIWDIILKNEFLYFLNFFCFYKWKTKCRAYYFNLRISAIYNWIKFWVLNIIISLLVAVVADELKWSRIWSALSSFIMVSILGNKYELNKMEMRKRKEEESKEVE